MMFLKIFQNFHPVVIFLSYLKADFKTVAYNGKYFYSVMFQNFVWLKLILFFLIIKVKTISYRKVRK